MIPLNTRLNEANYHGIPVVLFAPRCPGSEAYVDATLELLHRLGYAPKRRGDASIEKTWEPDGNDA